MEENNVNNTPDVFAGLSGNNPFLQELANQQAEQPHVEEKKEETPPVETAPATEQPKAEEETQKVIDPQKPTEAPSPWSKEANTKSFESLEDFEKYMNEQTGTEGRKLDAFVEDFKAIKQNNEELSVEATKAKNLETYIANLPPDLYSLLVAHDSGEDHRKLAKEMFDSKFDFTKPFEDHSEFKMLNHFYPGKFSSKEDYQTMKEDEPDKFQDYLELSEEKYSKAKTKFETQREAAMKRVVQADEQFVEKLNSSLKGTISHFRSEYPAFNEVQSKNVEKILNGGSASILSLFYDSNGLLKKEAAENAALVLYGKSEISKRNQKAINEAVSKANEEILSRGKDTPTVSDKPQSEATEDVNKEAVEEILKRYLPGNTKKVFS